MNWINAVKQKPESSAPVLCYGKSYDTRGLLGYFVASWHALWADPQWTIGKQQEEPEEVLFWAEIPGPEVQP